MSAPLFLGFDLSTQQLKAILITETTAIVHESSIHFDNDLPQYGTSNGAIHSKNGDGEVTVPVALWLDALDLLFDKMKSGGVDFKRVKAIGGSAQQHGSVYLSLAAEDAIRRLDNSEPLRAQLSPIAFSLPNAPIWQDSSTSEECKVIQDAVGGAQELADITGSRAYERFTGSQILKISRRQPETYGVTANVCLISSFLSSIFLFAGEHSRNAASSFPAPIESSDASGMNLMNVLTHKYDDRLLQVCGEALRRKLGSEPVDGGTVLGNVGKYWKERWGFADDCIVSPFTGDNPATVASLIATPGSALLSLGTSSTFLLSLPPSSSAPKRTTTSHLLAHPTSKDSSIIMLCYKNGALAREGVRDLRADKSWDVFNNLVENTKPGNGKVMGLYFPLKEIIPPNVQGSYFFNVQDSGDPKLLEGIPPSAEPRAILESQLLSIKSRMLSIMPPNTPRLSKVLVTGGSAGNKIIQQMVADVFNMDVYVASEEGSKEAAAMGGALLSKWAWWRNENPVKSDRSYEAMRAEEKDTSAQQVLVANPLEDNVTVYEGLVDAYRKCEDLVIKQYESAVI